MFDTIPTQTNPKSDHLSVYKTKDSTTQISENNRDRIQHDSSYSTNRIWPIADLYVKVSGSDKTSEVDTPEITSEDVETTVKNIFWRGLGVRFEYGHTNPFSDALRAFISTFGNAGIEALADFMQRDSTNEELIFEALRVLGMIQDPTTHRLRRFVLTHSLKSRKARIRDGASMGLEFLEDPVALPLLEDAVNKETVKELREDMLLVVGELRLISKESVS